MHNNSVQWRFLPALATVALMSMAAPQQAHAQAAASAPAATASTPASRTPREVREEATPPGDLRPENPVAPQFKVPIGRKPIEAPKTAAERERGKKAAASGGIDDAAARCLAQTSEAARAACRERNGKGAGVPMPTKAP